jgi:hypothetical protein
MLGVRTASISVIDVYPIKTRYEMKKVSLRSVPFFRITDISILYCGNWKTKDDIIPQGIIMINNLLMVLLESNIC